MVVVLGDAINARLNNPYTAIPRQCSLHHVMIYQGAMIKEPYTAHKEIIEASIEEKRLVPRNIHLVWNFPLIAMGMLYHGKRLMQVCGSQTTPTLYPLQHLLPKWSVQLAIMYINNPIIPLSIDNSYISADSPIDLQLDTCEGFMQGGLTLQAAIVQQTYSHI